MANIMINEVCNLNCSYCFANEYVNNKECFREHSGNMTFENFKKAVEFTLKGSKQIRILGGEPTLHPEFEKMINYVVNDNRVDYVHIFTNGLILDKYEELIKNDKVTFMINLNSPNDISKKNYDKTIKNIEALIKMGKRRKTVLGINMYKEDFDYEYILEALQKFEFKTVRTSICVPNEETNSDVGTLGYFFSMKPRVLEFFNKLQKIGVMPTYDCNIMPTCVTTPLEKDRLSKLYDFEKEVNYYCNVNDCSNCGATLDILTDLSIVRCFGLSREKKIKIDDFDHPAEAADYFHKEYDKYAYDVVADNTCINCNLRLEKKCMGGCLAFKVKEINKLKKGE